MSRARRTIDFRGNIPKVGPIAFLRAEIIRPLALIHYSIHGEENPMGLRLDLDKRVFLDELDVINAKGFRKDENDKFQQTAEEIVEYLAQELKTPARVPLKK